MEGCVKLFGCVIDVYLSHPLLMEAEPEAMRIRKDASLVDENVRVARVTRVTRRREPDVDRSSGFRSADFPHQFRRCLW